MASGGCHRFRKGIDSCKHESEIWTHEAAPKATGANTPRRI